jgi:predicted metal-dependent hydrolase
MRHEVVRSAKRRKTVQARLVNGVVQVSIPARMSKAEEERWVAEMVGRFTRRQSTEAVDLAARAEVLATRYGLPQPASIRWVDNQEWRWGSCTPADRTIRVSTRLAGFPAWVVDYVIVHELAHLVVGGHGRDFWALVERYPKTERARGFLMAKGLDGEDEAPPRPAVVPRMQDPTPKIEAEEPSATLF